MESKEVKKFSIIIIESLRPTDIKAGSILHQNTIKSITAKEKSLTSELHVISTKKELFELLEQLKKEAYEENHFFTLHFQVHGDDGRIQLSSYEIISWKELFPVFREINIRFNNLLSIQLSTCFGASIIQFIDPNKRAPFRAIVGTVDAVYQTDVLHFDSFYNDFFFNFAPYEATSILNNAINPDQKTFHCITADECIKKFEAPNTKISSWNKPLYEEAFLEMNKNPDKYLGKSVHEVKSELETKKLELLKTEIPQLKDHFLMKDLRKKDST